MREEPLRDEQIQFLYDSIKRMENDIRIIKNDVDLKVKTEFKYLEIISKLTDKIKSK